MRHFYFALFNLIALGLIAQGNAFIENKGQWEGDFDFKYTSPSADIYLNRTEITTDLRKYSYEDDHSDHKHNVDHDHKIPSGVKGHVYRWKFEGSNRKPGVVPSQKRKEYYNYLIGNDKKKWANHVNLYEEVNYEDLYKNIDLTFHFSAYGEVKYDLILHPGASVQDIQIAYEGADNIQIINGELHIKTSVVDAIEGRPYAYQVIEGITHKVECEYILQENKLSFRTGAFNPDYDLVIDPTLVYSTYSGSTWDNWGYCATYGQNETAYGGGVVFYTVNPVSSGYPVTTGAYQQNHGGGNRDVSLSKFDTKTGNLIYATYLGGNQADNPLSLLEDPNKRLIILGETRSDDFPTTSTAYQEDHLGNNAEIFVTILDSTGGSLYGSTYIGGRNNDGQTGIRLNYGDEFRGDIALDQNNNIIIASNSNCNQITHT